MFLGGSHQRFGKFRLWSKLKIGGIYLVLLEGSLSQKFASCPNHPSAGALQCQCYRINLSSLSERVQTAMLFDYACCDWPWRLHSCRIVAITFAVDCGSINVHGHLDERPFQASWFLALELSLLSDKLVVYGVNLTGASSFCLIQTMPNCLQHSSCLSWPSGFMRKSSRISFVEQLKMKTLTLLPMLESTHLYMLCDLTVWGEL